MKRSDLVIFLLLILCAVSVVHTQHRARRLFVDLQSERSVGEQLASDLRRLQSDQATLAAANRVERAASGLHMRVPELAATRIIQALPVLADRASDHPAPGTPVPSDPASVSARPGVQIAREAPP